LATVTITRLRRQYSDAPAEEAAFFYLPGRFDRRESSFSDDPACLPRAAPMAPMAESFQSGRGAPPKILGNERHTAQPLIQLKSAMAQPINSFSIKTGGTPTVPSKYDQVARGRSPAIRPENPPSRSKGDRASNSAQRVPLFPARGQLCRRGLRTARTLPFDSFGYEGWPEVIEESRSPGGFRGLKTGRPCGRVGPGPFFDEPVRLAYGGTFPSFLPRFP